MHQSQEQYYEALWREIERKRRVELEQKPKKVKNPALENLRNKAVTSLKDYPLLRTPQFSQHLRNIGPFKLDYCANVKSRGTCNYGQKCDFYHDQDIDKLKTAILSKILRNMKAIDGNSNSSTNRRNKKK